jgi:hypothetical protein
MNPILRNILAVVAGIFIGGLVNMGIINISGWVIPPPEGAITTTLEGLKESLHLFEPKHFIMPFLAHALGTFVGALITAFIVLKRKMRFAMVIGIFYLIGGAMNILMLPSPILFSIIDLSLAYIPMAYLGGILAMKYSKI